MEIKIEKKNRDIFNLYVNEEYAWTLLDKKGVIKELTKLVNEL